MIPEYYAIVYMYLFLQWKDKVSKYQFQAFMASMYYHVVGFNCMYAAFYLQEYFTYSCIRMF